MASQSRLERLPAELRNRIYRYTVVKYGPIKVTDGTVFHRGRHFEQPHIAMTNHMIRNETLPIFYGENSFVCDMQLGSDGAEHVLRTWLDPIKSHAADIKSVGVFVWISPDMEALEPNPFSISGREKCLLASLNRDRGIEYYFRARAGANDPTCTCQLRRVAHECKQVGDVEDVLVTLFLACIEDMNRTCRLMYRDRPSCTRCK